ncbi:MAG: hypothetical protein IKS69_07900 [Erysipelotrichaceae bacterium]|nr:hypothetical protein [Erysipelotrichaceae bacterium]
MIKTLVMIRDIVMCIGALIGMFLIGYVRVSFSTRQQKTKTPLDYNDKERKLRKIAIIILAITMALALIPTRNLV